MQICLHLINKETIADIFIFDLKLSQKLRFESSFPKYHLTLVKYTCSNLL